MMMKRVVGLIVVFFLVLTCFVEAADYDAGVQGKVILQTESTSTGDPIAYLKTERPKITVMAVDIAPGAETGWHIHPVPVYAYVLAGRLTVEVEDGKSFEFKGGDAIIEVVNKRHNGINKGSVPVSLIVFYTGGKGIPNVIKSDHR
jgi:quercetin dioxygenase-like cupin family protein